MELYNKNGARGVDGRGVYHSLPRDYPLEGRKRRWLAIGAISAIIFLALSAFFGYLIYHYFFSEEESKIFTQQSPVNIVTSDVEFDRKLKDKTFVVSYREEDVHKITNTGHGWKISLRDDGGNSTIRATHLPGLYKLVQVHGHWDYGSENGSEHVVNGRGFAAEIHFVHYNTKYQSFDEAMKIPGGLAVLAVFLESKINAEIDFSLEKIVHLAAENIKFKNDFVNIDGNTVNPKNLLPANKDFWTYDGSLTTPPYSETVIWTIFKNSLFLTEEKLSKLRMMKNCYKHDLRTNETLGYEMCSNSQGSLVRQIQPLNGRKIRSSFETKAS